MTATPDADKPSPQQAFDARYISSSQICKQLGISRPTFSGACKTGYMPEPIRVVGAGVLLFERAAVAPILEHWRLSLARRKGSHTQPQQAAAAA